MLEHLYGEEIFEHNWREITSYKKACKVLGIEVLKFREIGDRPQYMCMANAMQQLLVICEAINGNGKWYDENGCSYFPAFDLYSKDEMDELGKNECKSKEIHKLSTAANIDRLKNAAGIQQVIEGFYGVNSGVHYGFPISFNSEEKANFVGKQFFELCCQCYGLTLQKD